MLKMHLHVSISMKLLLFSILLLHLQSPISAEDPIFTVCYESSNYTSGSRYETNLNTLLSSLSTNGSLRNDTFYNATYGDDPDKVYGFSQCMSGASVDQCRQCLSNSTVEIVRRCPNRSEATIRYYNCILRYSNQNFFSQIDTGVRWAAYPVAAPPNATLFNIQLRGLMDDLLSAAAPAASKYATALTSYNEFQNISGLAQCTRDLSENGCNRCLRSMIEYIPTCCDGRTGGNVYSVSCNIRYETYSFFDPSPPPPLPPPPPVAPPPFPTVDSPPKNSTDDSGTYST